jgi:hypothetical protein
MTRLTEQAKSEIRRLRKTGMTREALAKRFHCGGSSIERVVREREQRLDAQEVQLIIHLHEAEYLEAKQLAIRFGVPEASVNEILDGYEKRAHNPNALKRTHERGETPFGKL